MPVNTYPAILAEPDEDTPRIASADWLDEHDEPLRAEFVRLQLKLARMEMNDPERSKIKRREVEILLSGNKQNDFFAYDQDGWTTGLITKNRDLSTGDTSLLDPEFERGYSVGVTLPLFVTPGTFSVTHNLQDIRRVNLVYGAVLNPDRVNPANFDGAGPDSVPVFFHGASEKFLHGLQEVAVNGPFNNPALPVGSIVLRKHSLPNLRLLIWNAPMNVDGANQLHRAFPDVYIFPAGETVPVHNDASVARDEIEYHNRQPGVASNLPYFERRWYEMIEHKQMVSAVRLEKQRRKNLGSPDQPPSSPPPPGTGFFTRNIGG